MNDDYYVLLIIITIIGFLITIALSIFFIYIPYQRASAKFDNIVKRGRQVLIEGEEVANDVNQTAVLLSDFFVSLCTGIENNEGLLLTEINQSGTFDDVCSFILSQS